MNQALLPTALDELDKAKKRWDTFLSLYFEEKEKLSQELMAVFSRHRGGSRGGILSPRQNRVKYNVANRIAKRISKLSLKSQEAEEEVSSLLNFINSTYNQSNN